MSDISNNSYPLTLSFKFLSAFLPNFVPTLLLFHPFLYCSTLSLTQFFLNVTFHTCSLFLLTFPSFRFVLQIIFVFMCAFERACVCTFCPLSHPLNLWPGGWRLEGSLWESRPSGISLYRKSNVSEFI